MALGLVKAATAGTNSSQMPKMRIKKIPVTNSGVAVAPRLVIEMILSKGLPSLMPAKTPNTSASGMTMAKAAPAKTNVLRNLGPSVTATGRPY